MRMNTIHIDSHLLLNIDIIELCEICDYFISEGKSDLLVMVNECIQEKENQLVVDEVKINL